MDAALAESLAVFDTGLRGLDRLPPVQACSRVAEFEMRLAIAEYLANCAPARAADRSGAGPPVADLAEPPPRPAGAGHTGPCASRGMPQVAGYADAHADAHLDADPNACAHPDANADARAYLDACLDAYA